MNDSIENCRVGGQIMLEGEDIYASKIDVVQLRARVGMVFQKPNPFPKSIYDNMSLMVHAFMAWRKTVTHWMKL